MALTNMRWQNWKLIADYPLIILITYFSTTDLCADVSYFCTQAIDQSFVYLDEHPTGK